MRAGMQPAGQMGAHKAAGFALKLCASSLCFMSGCGLIATTTARVLHQFVAQLSASCACAVPRCLQLRDGPHKARQLRRLRGDVQRQRGVPV